MTIGTNRRNDAIGNNATSQYSYGFKIFAATDLKATVRHPTTNVETVLAYLTHYTVAGVGDKGGGSITLLGNFDWTDVSGNLLQDWALALTRNIDVKQETDVRNQGGFQQSVHEDAFDYFVMIDQKQQDQLDRSLSAPETYSSISAATQLTVGASGAAAGLPANPSGYARIDIGGTVFVMPYFAAQ